MLAGKSVTIRDRVILCLGALSAVAVAQCVASFTLGYGLRENAKTQHMLSDVRVAQMYGDMKHDGIQGDVFRLIDAVQHKDAARRDQTLKDIDFDIGEIDKTYGIVFAQHYSAGLQDKVDVVRQDEQAYVAQARAISGAVVATPEDYHTQLGSFTEAFDRFEKSQNGLAEALKAEGGGQDAAATRLATITVIAQIVIMAVGAAGLAWALRLMLRGVVDPIARLAQMMRRMGEITGLVNEIAMAAEQQSASLQQVNDAVSEMDRVTQQNAAMVEETTAATRSLAEEAGQLARLVCGFRTRDTAKRPVFVTNTGEMRRTTNRSDQGVAGRKAVESLATGDAQAVAVGQDWSSF